MYISKGGDLVPSLPVGVSEIWMEMGTFTSQMGADGIWPYGYAFKIARNCGYNIYRVIVSGFVLHHITTWGD